MRKAPALGFSFRDLYPGGEGLLTGERAIPEVEDKQALGIALIRRVEEEERAKNGRKLIVLFVLLAVLVVFRYI